MKATRSKLPRLRLFLALTLLASAIVITAGFLLILYYKMTIVEIVIEEVLGGRTSEGRIEFIPTSLSVRAFHLNTSFPVNPRVMLHVKEPAIHAFFQPERLIRSGLRLYREGTGMALSISDADVTLEVFDEDRDIKGVFRKKYRPPGEVRRIPPDMKIEVYNSRLSLKNVRGIPEHFTVFELIEGTMTMHEGNISATGSGFLSHPDGIRQRLPVTFLITREHAVNEVYYEVHSSLGTLRSDLKIVDRIDDQEIRHWYHEFDLNNITDLCYYLHDNCPDGQISARGQFNADLNYYRNEGRAYIDVRTDVDRPVEEFHFTGNVTGTFLRQDQSIDIVADLNRESENWQTEGIIDLEKREYNGNLRITVDKLEAWNDFFHRDPGIPPGKAIINSSISIPLKNPRLLNASGHFYFGGYKLSEVERAQSFMKFLKITEEGMDADELTIPRSQGIGLEILEGSGGYFTINEGIFRTRRFSIYTDTMHAFLYGTVNIPGERMDLYLRFQGLRQVERLIDRIPVYIPFIRRGPEDSILDLNFRIRGPLSGPQMIPVYTIPDPETL